MVNLEARDLVCHEERCANQGYRPTWVELRIFVPRLCRHVQRGTGRGAVSSVDLLQSHKDSRRRCLGLEGGCPPPEQLPKLHGTIQGLNNRSEMTS